MNCRGSEALKGVLLAAMVLAGTAQAQADGGEPEINLPMFDGVQTPWGPGRKSSGEVFHTAVTPLAEAPFQWSWYRLSLGVGGQYFARGEARDNADFLTAKPDLSIGFEQRARLSVRASAFERVGVFIELQDVRAWGSEPSTTTLAADAALHQGFVDVKAAPFLDLRVGRQELSYGEERLIGSLDWSQTARAFDGIFVRVTASPTVTIDAFGMLLRAKTTLIAESGGTRFQTSGSYFTGLYARGRWARIGADLYALGSLEDPSTAATGFLPNNNRLTIGARALTTVSHLALVGEGAFQTGTALNDTVLAGAFAGKATWVFAVAGAPYVMAEFSGASGGESASDSTNSTFNQLFPTGHTHLGYMDFVGWQNVVAVRGSIGFRPGNAHVWLDVHHFSAWSPKDAWYAANGSVFIAADPLRTNGNRGTEVDLSATVSLWANLSMAGGFGLFLPERGAWAAAGSSIGKGTNAATWGFLSLRAQL